MCMCVFPQLLERSRDSVVFVFIEQEKLTKFYWVENHSQFLNIQSSHETPGWGAFVCRRFSLLFDLNVKTPVPDLTALGIMLNPHFRTPVVFLQSKKALNI